MKPFRILLIVLWVFFTASNVKATDGDGLERVIRLPKAKGTVYSLLGKVSEQSGYLFIYDSKIINNDSIVKTKRKDCSIRQAIYEITGRKQLILTVLGNHILITQPTVKASVSKSSATSFLPSNSILVGTLLDKETGASVANASVMIQGTSVGSITNQNGEFRLHLPDSLNNAVVFFSHIGYVPQYVKASTLAGRNNVLSMEPKVIPLQEVLIRLVDPKKLLCEMMEYRQNNYSSVPVYLTTFYREGVQLKNKFQSLTEAVFKVYKSSVMEPDVSDQVKLLKMSRIDNLEVKDSLVAKIRSGVDACLQLDIVKNIPDFLSVESGEQLYVYTSGDIVSVDDRSAHIVCFEQKHGIEEPLFCGELYIDSENSALLQARFEIRSEYVKAATRLFVVRQASKIKLTTQKIVYTISYKPWNGIYYIHHIRGDLYFKMKKRRALFSNPTLYTWFEMVTCCIDNENVVRFPRSERISTHTVFADTDFKYDESFWGDFNVIPLEESLSKVIERIAVKIEKTELP